MEVKVYTLNSFAKYKDGGNPAGVVLDADNLSEKEMKKIASIIGFSETAFVMSSNIGNFKVRFFTPNDEVDICGHATIATFSILFRKGYIKVGKYSQETNAGVLSVELNEDLSIMMNQNTPSYYEILDKEEIAGSLNIKTSDMIDDLPIQIVSTGLKDIIIPIKNIDIVNSIQPNIDMITNICRKYNAIGYHMFTLETRNYSNAYCRNFAPLYGITEESATGTSNGALACYLHKYSKIFHNINSPMFFEQGYSMGSPSEIIVELVTKLNEIIEVKVGGKAFDVSELKVQI